MSDNKLMNTYGKLPITIDSGSGSWLTDQQGNRYLDTVSGIAVCGLGHCHPAVVEAVARQAKKLMHCSNLYHHTLENTLAEKLTRVGEMTSCFFCNSGAEANEAAIKLARLRAHRKGNHSPKVVVMEGSFHGRTLATLSATANRKAQAGFEPLVSGFIRIPYDDVDALKQVAEHSPETCAVLVEPIQGEGGIRVPHPDYLKQIRQICSEHDWLMMLDEVQTGNGRCGAYFAWQHYGVKPDVVTTAKGLGNGFPVAACLAAPEAADVFTPGSHGSTFGGNPMACAAAIAVIDTIQQEQLTIRARQLGEKIINDLKAALDHAEYIKDIRGVGLMIGIETNAPCPELVPLAKMQGLLINVTAENVIRLLPPLTMTDEEADRMTSTLIKLIKVHAGDDRKAPR